MSIEAALVQPITDAILAGLKKVYGVKVKKNTASELNEVIRNLLQINPDLPAAEVKIHAAKALGEISRELILAEKMLASVRGRSGMVVREPPTKYARITATPAEKMPATKKAAAIKKSATKMANAAKKVAPATRRPIPKSAETK